jgi:hypothetical protein
MNQTQDYAHKLARTMAAQQMSLNIYRVTSDDIEEMLKARPDLVARLEGLNLESLARDTLDAIGTIGIQEKIGEVMAGAIEAAASKAVSGG